MSRAEACRYLFEIIRYSLAGGEAPTIPEGVDWEKLYRICKFHKIEAVVAHGIDKISGKEQIPQEVRRYAGDRMCLKSLVYECIFS